MLQCNMDAATDSSLRLDLEDILGSLRYARRTNDLGRLALLTFCEVRRWARMAHQDGLAARATGLFTERPPGSREEFLALVDGVIDELEAIRGQLH